MKKTNLRKLTATTLVTLTIGLCGCSSKPESSDIATGLAAEFQCPILEVNNVKKTDGVDSGEKSYEVSYTFQVALKGGTSAAATLLPELDALNERLERWRLQYERASNAAAVAGPNAGSSSTDADPATGRAQKEVIALKKRLTEIQPCELPNARFAIDRMRAAAQPQAGSTQQTPVGLVMRGTSSMIKAESGWRFAAPPRFDIKAEQVMRGEPLPHRSSVALWTEFSEPAGAFIASVPSEGQCRYEIDSQTGRSWRQCSFETANTFMDIWFGKVSGPEHTAGSEEYLEAKMKDIAERHSEQVIDAKPIKLANILAKDFTVKSESAERKIRIFAAGKYEVQAIASPRSGTAANIEEMGKFIAGVKPAFISD